MNQYNDYELLYLIYEGDEEALGTIFNKYDPLIKKKLYDFKVARGLYDDFYQEGLIILYLAVKKYNPLYEKSFMRFFELLLTRHIITLMRKGRGRFTQVTIVEDVNMLKDDSNQFDYQGIVLSDYQRRGVLFENKNLFLPANYLTDCEKEVFKLKYFEGLSYKEIASITKSDIRKVYNLAYLVKVKLRKLASSDKMD